MKPRCGCLGAPGKSPGLHNSGSWPKQTLKGRKRATTIDHTPSTADTFTARTPKPYNSRHLKPPEHFLILTPSIRPGTPPFFRSGSGERPTELVMEFPAVLREHAWNGRLPCSVCSLFFSLSLFELKHLDFIGEERSRERMIGPKNGLNNHVTLPCTCCPFDVP